MIRALRKRLARVPPGKYPLLATVCTVATLAVMFPVGVWFPLATPVRARLLKDTCNFQFCTRPARDIALDGGVSPVRPFCREHRRRAAHEMSWPGAAMGLPVLLWGVLCLGLAFDYLRRGWKGGDRKWAAELERDPLMVVGKGPLLVISAGVLFWFFFFTTRDWGVAPWFDRLFAAG